MRHPHRAFAVSAALLALSLSAETLAAPPRLTVRALPPQATAPSAHGGAGREKVSPDERATPARLREAARAVIARDAGALDLGAAVMIPFRDGDRVLRFPQLHRGLPVLSAGAGVVFGPDDAPRLMTLRLARELPAAAIPTLPAAAAAQAATAAIGVAVDPTRTTLAVWPGPDSARLVWVASPLPTPGTPYAPVALIDAHTGDLLLRFNSATTARGLVFPANPARTPDLVEVELPLEVGASSLQNDLIRVLNCVDQQAVKDVNGSAVHLCDLLQKAAPDATGDFLLPPEGDTAPEDAFAEVQMFHHANRAYELFRSFSPGFKVQSAPLTAVVNLRLPQGYPSSAAKMADPGLLLAPYAKAFFSPADPGAQALFGIGGGAMWFGQGPTRDYGHDGDVIYHELTHAMIAATAQLVQHPHLDDLGLSFAPSAMNEALADYFSSALTGDPVFGEHSAADLGQKPEFIRSLEGQDACPTAIGGEPHQDATLFSGALWDVRRGLSPSQAEVFNLAVFKAVASAPSGDLAYEDLASLVQAEVASSLAGATAGAVTAAFELRGVLPRCTRVLESTGETMFGPEDFFSLWFAPGSATAGTSGPAPGVVQIHHRLPEGAGGLRVSFEQVAVSGGFQQGTPFAPTLWVKTGAEPITFGGSPFAPLGEVMAVETQKQGYGHVVTVDLPPGTRDVFLMIGNAGQADGAYTHILIEALPSAPPGSQEEGGCSFPLRGEGGAGPILGIFCFAVPWMRRRGSRRVRAA